MSDPISIIFVLRIIYFLIVICGLVAATLTCLETRAVYKGLVDDKRNGLRQHVAYRDLKEARQMLMAQVVLIVLSVVGLMMPTGGRSAEFVRANAWFFFASIVSQLGLALIISYRNVEGLREKRVLMRMLVAEDLEMADRKTSDADSNFAKGEAAESKRRDE